MKVVLLNAVLVGLGGFGGSVLRYLLHGMLNRTLTSVTFPFATLAVNLIGCFSIGLVAGLAESRGLFGPQARVFLIVGLLGGFTTFSTFGYESFVLLRQGDALGAIANVAAQVVLGLGLVWAGFAVAGGTG